MRASERARIGESANSGTADVVLDWEEDVDLLVVEVEVAFDWDNVSWTLSKTVLVQLGKEPALKLWK